MNDDTFLDKYERLYLIYITYYKGFNKCYFNSTTLQTVRLV